MGVVLKHKKADPKEKVLHQLSLLLEVRNDGFEEAIKYRRGEDRIFIMSLKDLSNQELATERKRLSELLYS